jgi:hypothetical protein
MDNLAKGIRLTWELLLDLIPKIYDTPRSLRILGQDGAEKYAEVKWWQTDMLPEPLRHDSGHEGSHCFITHEFVDAIAKGRKPFVGIDEALAYTVPGMIAHQSALNGGQSLKIPTITG